MTKRILQNPHNWDTSEYDKFGITPEIQKHGQYRKMRNMNVFTDIDNRCK